MLKEDEIAKIIVQAALELHRELGPGLLESVYEVIFANLLREKGLEVKRQVPIPISFREMRFDEGFRADLIVDKLVLVELKSISALAPVHRKQVITYLRLANLKLGLLVNFGGELIKGNIERLVNHLPSSE